MYHSSARWARAYTLPEADRGVFVTEMGDRGAVPVVQGLLPLPSASLIGFQPHLTAVGGGQGDQATDAGHDRQRATVTIFNGSGQPCCVGNEGT